jgi:hypothetical protein
VPRDTLLVGVRDYFFAPRRFALVQAREGDLRLSAKQPAGAPDSEKRSARPAKDRKQDKANVVGRALRTIYDETLREDIPDDFLDLLGKLD